MDENVGSLISSLEARLSAGDLPEWKQFDYLLSLADEIQKEYPERRLREIYEELSMRPYGVSRYKLEGYHDLKISVEKHNLPHLLQDFKEGKIKLSIALRKSVASEMQICTMCGESKSREYFQWESIHRSRSNCMSCDSRKNGRRAPGKPGEEKKQKRKPKTDFHDIDNRIQSSISEFEKTRNRHNNDTQIVTGQVDIIEARINGCRDKISDIWPLLDSVDRIIVRDRILNIFGSMIELVNIIRSDTNGEKEKEE